jgi:hypothetical protein
MASDFTKGLITGTLLGGSNTTDKKTAEELSRQNRLSEDRMWREEEWRRHQAGAEWERERRAQAELGSLGNTLERLEEALRQQQTQLAAIGESQRSASDTEEETDQRLSQVQDNMEQLLTGIQDVHDVLIRTQLAALPPDPRYLVNRFPPAKLYDEYMESGEVLTATNLFLPRSWVDYLDRECATPANHCLFVCSDFQVVPKVVETLSKDHGGKGHRVVVDQPITPSMLAGSFTKLDGEDLLILVDRRGFVSDYVADCLLRCIRESKLEIIIDQGPNAHAINLQLPKFRLYWITSAVTKAANALSAIFPQEVVIANLGRVNRTAVIGAIASTHELRLDYQAASNLLAAAEELNLLPETFAESVCKEHPDLVRELAAGGLAVGDFIGKVR